MNILDCQSCLANFKMYLKLYKHRNASLKLNSKLNKRFWSFHISELDSSISVMFYWIIFTRVRADFPDFNMVLTYARLLSKLC